MDDGTLTGSQVTLLLGVVGVFVAFALLAWFFSPYQEIVRALRGQPRAKIASALEGGAIRVVGRLQLGAESLVAPLSGRKCAHYLVIVEEETSDGESTSWSERGRETRTCDFVVEDDTGAAIVRATVGLQAAVVLDGHWQSGKVDGAKQKALLTRLKIPETTWLGTGRPLRYREGVFEPGEIVGVLGRAHWKDETDGTGYRESKRQRLEVGPMRDGKLLASDDPATLD